MSHLEIEVEKRETRGKNANRRLRSEGRLPAVVYGGGVDPLAIQIEIRTLEDLMRTAGSENAVFLLKLAGTKESRHTMIRELQQDAVTGELIHVDFQRILLDQKVRVMVPIELHGTAQGVKNEGGLLDFVTREVEVECLPDKIPVSLPIDVGPLHVGQHLEVAQLELPEGVALHVEPERVLVSVTARRGGPEDEVEEEEELLEKVTAEPEVIKRGKDEED